MTTFAPIPSMREAYWLIVNPGGDSNYVLPLAEQDAEAAGWRRGSCFDGSWVALLQFCLTCPPPSHPRITHYRSLNTYALHHPKKKKKYIYIYTKIAR